MAVSGLVVESNEIIECPKNRYGMNMYPEKRVTGFPLIYILMGVPNAPHDIPKCRDRRDVPRISETGSFNFTALCERDYRLINQLQGSAVSTMANACPVK